MSRLFRLIVDGPLSGTFNMAADEYLLNTQKNGASPPVFRIYRWNSATVSIGYFQQVSVLAARLGFSRKKTPVVRRITGGGLVYHGKDLTFSICLPDPNSFFTGDVKDSYLKVNEAIRVGLKSRFSGIDYADCKNLPSGRGQGDRLCFDNPVCHDLLLDGKKILGASQRRLGGAILHQSALFLERDPEELAGLLISGFEKLWEIRFERSAWTGEELERIRRIERERYSQKEWACPEII